MVLRPSIEIAGGGEHLFLVLPDLAAGHAAIPRGLAAQERTGPDATPCAHDRRVRPVPGGERAGYFDLPRGSGKVGAGAGSFLLAVFGFFCSRLLRR
jgi:hypothetical protein